MFSLIDTFVGEWKKLKEKLNEEALDSKLVIHHDEEDDTAPVPPVIAFAENNTSPAANINIHGDPSMTSSPPAEAAVLTATATVVHANSSDADGHKGSGSEEKKEFPKVNVNVNAASFDHSTEMAFGSRGDVGVLPARPLLPPLTSHIHHHLIKDSNAEGSGAVSIADEPPMPGAVVDHQTNNNM
jgi:hypothetical protein